MKRLLRSRILRRILLGYGLVATLLGAGLAITARRFDALNGAFGALLAHDVALIDEAERLERLVGVMRASERAYVRTGEVEFRTRFVEAAGDVPAAVARVERAVHGRPREQARVEAVEASLRAWLAAVQAELALRDAVARGAVDPAAAEARLRAGAVVARSRAVDEGLEGLHDAALAGVAARHRAASVASAATRRDTVLVMVLAALLALGYGSVVARDLGGGLAALQSAMQDLGRGVVPAGRSARRDEIGDVTHTFEDLARRLNAAETELRARVAAQARAVDELREANLALAHAMRAREDFVATMSHELRTPLNAVIGLAALLLDSPREQLSTRARQALGTMRDSGTHLLALLDDLLDFARLDAGRLSVVSVPVDLVVLARACVATTAALLGDGPVSLALDAPSSLHVRGDPQRLRQVLLNLLSNAAKFTPTGSITVRLREGPEGVLLEVEDTGIGIAGGSHVAVFEPFHQEARGTTRDHGGTGLGLTLARRMVRAMGGELSLERSAPGQGSLFRVRLPGDAAGQEG